VNPFSAAASDRGLSRLSRGDYLSVRLNPDRLSPQDTMLV